MLSSSLYRKLFISVQLTVLIFSIAIYFFAVPIVKTTVYELEKKSTSTLLNNIDSLIRIQSSSIDSYWKAITSTHQKQLEKTASIYQAIILSYLRKSVQNEIPKRIAKSQALIHLNDLRDKIKTTVWIIDYDSKVLSHPLDSIHQKNASTLKDSYDNLIFPPIVKEARTKKEGFFRYWTSKNEGKVREKLVYFLDIPEWEWVIGTEVFIDAIDDEIEIRDKSMISELRKIAYQIQGTQNGELIVFDSELNIKISSNSLIEGKKIDEILSRGNPNKISHKIIEKYEENKPVQIRWDRPDDINNHSYNTTLKLRYSKDFDWYIGIILYDEYLYKGASKLSEHIIYVVILLLIMLNLIAVLFLSRVLGPVKQLSNIAIQVRDGNLDVQTKVKSNDEIGILASTFNRMIQKIKERTETLTSLNQELSIAKLEAEKANQSKSRFVAATSHDLSQPLNAARLFSTILKQKTDGCSLNSEEIVKLANNIDSSLSNAEDILSDILDISKLDSGAVHPNIEPLPLSSILTPIADEFFVISKDKAFEFRFVNSSKVILSDKKMLRRIIQNFISNAFRYTKTGKVLLGCRQKAGYIQLQVWDTGPGIPKNKQTEIFEEFRRIDRNDNTGEKCLGLGLAITERLAGILNHKIEVISSLNKGSMFAISIPLYNKEIEIDNTKISSKTRISNVLQGKNILCIDNEEKTLGAMKTLLESWSCRVTTAKSIEDIEIIIEKNEAKFDLILSDYHLDFGITGLEVIDFFLNKTDHNPEIIFITGESSKDTLEKISARGYPILQKPLKPASLRALMNKLIQE